MPIRSPTLLPLAGGLAVLVAAGITAARCDRGPVPSQEPAATSTGQGSTVAAAGDYDLDRPLRHFDLPAALREVSAVTCIDAHTVACLQDEKGIVFSIDIRDGKVRAVQPFGPDGDYEGLTRVGDDYWVLRSDGLLCRIASRGPRLEIVETFPLATPNQDLEGLCHDPARGALLVAPKDIVKPTEKGPKRTKGDRRRGDDRDVEAGAQDAPSAKEARDQRVVFAWDLKQRALLAEPVLRLSLEHLKRRAEARGHDLPTRTNRRGKERTVLRMLFSCIAVQPRTGEVYLLSAADHVLLVVDRKGALRDVHLLDEDMLPKPEGLTFMPNGDLVLSSEGVDGPARLVVYGQR